MASESRLPRVNVSLNSMNQNKQYRIVCFVLLRIPAKFFLKWTLAYSRLPNHKKSESKIWTFIAEPVRASRQKNTRGICTRPLGSYIARKYCTVAFNLRSCCFGIMLCEVLTNWRRRLSAPAVFLLHEKMGVTDAHAVQHYIYLYIFPNKIR